MFKNGKKTLSFLLAIAMIATLIPANIAFASTAEKGTALDRSGIQTDIRFALFGDTHVTAFPEKDWTSPSDALDGIMDAYHEIDPNMDAFVMPGDVIYNVQPSLEKTTDDVVKYKAVLAEINEEFPTASTYEADGKKANIIWSMGNHEITLGAYKGTATTNFTAGTWEAEVADNHAKYEEALKRKPIDTYTVNGYTFVTSAPYDYLNNYVNPNDKTTISEYETKIKGYLEDALKADATKPVFYLQHEAIDRTNIASATAENPTRNSAEFRKFVVDHPRIITLSGHSHYAANDPRTFLQLENGSTHINIPATDGAAGSYGCTKDSVTDNAKATQGMLVEVTGAQVTVRAFDYVDKKYIGEPYVFTAGEEAKLEYTEAGREAAKTSEVNKAYFESGAAITVSDIESKSAKISFPEGKKDGESAANLHDDYIHYYRVKVTNKATGNTVKSYSLLGNYFLNSTNSKKTANRVVTLSGLSRGTEYNVTVTPESALGQQGTPLTVDFTTSSEKTAEDYALTKKFNQNVALGKTVTTIGNGTSSATGNTDATYPPSNLTDGSNDIIVLHDSASNGKTSLIVDLGETYNITKVVLQSRKDTHDDYGRNSFNILASNDPLFESYDRLGGMGSSNDATIFPRYGDYTIDCNTTKGYRYIMLERTAGAYCTYAELQVFADVYMTEISRNKPTEANVAYYANYKTSMAVDGINTSSKPGWWSAYPGAGNGKYETFGTDSVLDYLIVDLEDEYDVAQIDIEYQKGNADNEGSRQGWAVYGSNELSETGTSGIEGYTKVYRPAMTKATMPEGFEYLCGTGSGYYLPKYGTENIYKMYGNSVNKVGIINQPVSPSQKYRYITFKKLNNNIAQLGEVRVWVKNPVISSVEKVGNDITIIFSEEMNKDTLTANNIKVYNAGGNIIDGTYSVSEDGKIVTISGDGISNAFKLEASYLALSQTGMDLAGNRTKYFESDVDLSAKPIKQETSVNVAKGKKVTHSNINFATGSTSYKWLVDGSTQTQMYIESNIDSSAPSYFTLDLGQRFAIDKIVLDVPANSQIKQQTDILVSNDENFATYKRVYSVGALADVDNNTDFANGTTLTVVLDGIETYRYVRVNRKANAWMTLNEFSVYADRNLIELSRNASVHASKENNGAASKAVDGKNASASDGWRTNYGAPAQFLEVDLGAAYKIARIEMQDTAGDNNVAQRRWWSVYGSNEVDRTETGALVGGNNGAAKITNSLYTQLASTDEFYIPHYDGSSTEYPIEYHWLTYASDTAKGTAVQEFDNTAYRYITFKHRNEAYAALGEVKIYALAPKAASAKLSGNTVTVNFSDGMFPNYMATDYIKLYDADDNAVAMNNAEMVDDYTFRFTAELTPGKTYKVVADKSMKSLESIPLNVDNEITIVVPNISTSVTVKATETDEVATDFVVGTAYNFNVAVTSPFVADEPNVKIVVAQYNGDKLEKAEVKDITAIANTTTPVVLENFTYAEGNTFKVFAWKANFDEPYCAIIELGTQE